MVLLNIKNVSFGMVTIFCIFLVGSSSSHHGSKFSTSAHHDKIKEDKTACAKNYPPKIEKKLNERECLIGHTLGF